MKSPHQVKTDERDSARVLRWVVAAVIVLVIGALSYNYFAKQRMAQGPAQSMIQTGSVAAGAYLPAFA
jgi:hypothetical protein